MTIRLKLRQTGEESAYENSRHGAEGVRRLPDHGRSACCGRAAASLPGGVYNYGSENTLTMLETAQWLKGELGLSVRLTDAGPRHNLWMDCAKLREQGISFRSTVDGLKRCLEDYAL